MQRSIYPFWIASGISLFCISTPSSIQAQIVPDGTTPTLPAVCSVTCEITGGTQAGSNLFHSFSQFNVDVNQKVFFRDPGVSNIVSRVTGSNQSNILGTLGVSGGNANLFLINPNGIIFGPNASLDVKGSFVTTTANAIQFGDQGFFSASAPNNPALLTVNPSAFLFNQAAQIKDKSIINQSQQSPEGLKVNDGQSLLLLGGTVKLDGGPLTAKNGQVELAGVAGLGTVGLNYGDGNTLSLGFPDGLTRADVSLSQASVVTTDRGSGSIAVNAQNIDISGGSTLQAGIAQGLESIGNQAGDITLDATGVVTISGGGISNDVQSEAVGNAGSIRIKAKSLRLDNGANLNANVFGRGNAGGVYVQADNDVSIIGSSGIFNSPPSDKQGNGGDIHINAGSLLLDSSFIFTGTSGQGDAGEVFIQADNDVSLRGESIISTTTQPPSNLPELIGGNGGNINIQAESFSLKDGSKLLTSTAGGGRAGDITLKISDLVNLEGSNSGLFAETQKNSTGDGGNIFIDPRQVIIRDGAEVNVSSQGSGDAGDIEVIAGSALLDGGGKLTATSTSGKGGGNIRLQIIDLLLLRGNSGISTNAEAGLGQGGNIIIDTNLLVALENSDITANAFEGKGGNIQITTEGLFLLDSEITAKSERGIDGVVEINRPEAEPSSGLVTLPTELVEVSGLIAQGCAAGGGNVARGSQFVATGRGGLPPTPTEALRSDAVLADLGTPVKSQGRPSAASSNLPNFQPTPIVEAQGWVIGSKGEVVLTAQAPTVTRIPWLTPTSCNAS